MTVELMVDGVGNLATRLRSVQLIWIDRRPKIAGEASKYVPVAIF